jgi:hypothetical protein
MVCTLTGMGRPPSILYSHVTWEEDRREVDRESVCVCVDRRGGGVE